MEFSQVSKQYMKPIIKVLDLDTRTTLLQTSGLLDNTPADKPAKAPEFEEWDEF